MVKPTGQETTATEKTVCNSSQEEKAHHAMQDHIGKHQGLSGVRENKRKT